jgi:hypothetical protein
VRPRQATCTGKHSMVADRDDSLLISPTTKILGTRVMEEGRDQALMHVGAWQVSPPAKRSSRISKTVDLSASTLDNLGFDCSTTQHHFCQPWYISSRCLMPRPGLSMMNCRVAATILTACAHIQPFYPWFIVRHEVLDRKNCNRATRAFRRPEFKMYSF